MYLPSVVQSAQPNQTCLLHTEYWCTLQPNNGSGVTQFIDNRHLYLYISVYKHVYV